jgi:hypothetical protein
LWVIRALFGRPPPKSSELAARPPCLGRSEAGGVCVLVLKRRSGRASVSGWWPALASAGRHIDLTEAVGKEEETERRWKEKKKREAVV